MKDIKKIIENLFLPTLNSRSSKKSWWVNQSLEDEYNLILEKTSFLDNESKWSERLYCFYNNLLEIPKCVCGNNLKYSNFFNGYRHHCSILCSRRDPLEKSRREETNSIKYGVSNVSKNKNIIDKIQKTKKENWPEDNRCNWKKSVLTKRKQKIKEGNFLKDNLEYLYDFYNPFLTNEEMKFKCKKCNHEFLFEEWMYHNDSLRCPKCVPKWSSSYERKIKEFIEPLGISYSTDNRKIITPKELDIVFDKYNLAIEIHGLLWHSFGTQGKSYTNNAHIEDKNYHLNKTIECEKKNIVLFQIFQNELDDVNKFEIWKSMILNKLRKNEVIYARKCQIRELNNKEFKEFLDRNHLQGFVASSIKLGLFYDSELVACLSFSKSRFNKNYDWEITRFCNKKFINVVGGFSKLLSYFRKNWTGSIITYADKRYSNGDLYRKNGFIELKDSGPNYFYFTLKQLVLLSRVQFQKHKLKDKLENFDPSLSEAENMFNNGYRRIWDCGNKVFVLN